VDHDDAEDVLQETCIQVYRKIDQLKDKDQLLPWMYKIATRESLNILRHHTGLFRSLDGIGSSLERKLTTEYSPDADAAELLLQQALLKLPTQQRLTFCMRYYDDLSYEEIASITGKRVGTLKVNYFYATNKIKSYLKAHEI
jgi:RNA polymerase sigma-70 factor (ECF subfamily)